MRFAYFTHSLVSCWNHGNAHFLRGVLGELIRAGHSVRVYEPQNAWSLVNLLHDHGERGLEPFRRSYPELTSSTYLPGADLGQLVGDSDVVLVHEWSDPWLVAGLGRLRRGAGRFALFFHDTHHRAVSNADALRGLDLDGFDGVLAFGESLAEVYRHWGWGDRVFVWHEAADTRRFRPPADEPDRAGIVWIGNWGDGERSAEIEEFLLRPAAACGSTLEVFGVRYPDAALSVLQRYGAIYRGWLANAEVPAVFARRLATVHVPRRFYVERLPGIPTIRMFEALACGIPLVSAPWRDSEGLFKAGEDYLVAADGDAAARHIRDLHKDAALRRSLADSGSARIAARHTCGHRARELLDIVAKVGSARVAEFVA
jgi:spore maturation protein CgeB